MPYERLDLVVYFYFYFYLNSRLLHYELFHCNGRYIRTLNSTINSARLSIFQARCLSLYFVGSLYTRCLHRGKPVQWSGTWTAAVFVYANHFIGVAAINYYYKKNEYACYVNDVWLASSCRAEKNYIFYRHATVTWRNVWFGYLWVTIGNCKLNIDWILIDWLIDWWRVGRLTAHKHIITVSARIRFVSSEIREKQIGKADDLKLVTCWNPKIQDVWKLIEYRRWRLNVYTEPRHAGACWEHSNQLQDPTTAPQYLITFPYPHPFPHPINLYRRGIFLSKPITEEQWVNSLLNSNIVQCIVCKYHGVSIGGSNTDPARVYA